MSHKNLGPIGSAVLTFIGYKQTNRQTDKPNLYIDIISRTTTLLNDYCVNEVNGLFTITCETNKVYA